MTASRWVVGAVAVAITNSGSDPPTFFEAPIVRVERGWVIVRNGWRFSAETGAGEWGSSGWTLWASVEEYQAHADGLAAKTDEG